MHLFLQGQRGIGKSTLIREALRPVAPMLACFSTQRLVEAGNTIGYRVVLTEGTLCPVETAYKAGTQGVFLLRGKGDISVLEQRILQLERDLQKEHIKLILLDEIGGIELVSKQFMSSLNRILSGEKPCVGVFKSAENMAHTSSMLQLKPYYFKLHEKLEQCIVQKGALLTLTKENKQTVLSSLQKFVQGIVKS